MFYLSKRLSIYLITTILTYIFSYLFSESYGGLKIQYVLKGQAQ